MLFLNKKFFLDVKDRSCTDQLETNIRQFGGIIERFLSKEITCIVTDRGSAENLFLQKDESPVTHSPSSRRVSSVSRFMSRGQRLLMQSNSANDVSTCDPVAFAQMWGVTVLTLDTVLQAIDSKLSMCNPPPMAPEQSKKSHHLVKKTKFSGAYIKCEDINCSFRPFFSQHSKFPHVQFDDNLSNGIFKSAETTRPFPVRRTMSTTVDSRKQVVCNKRGYCECCDVMYENIDQHLASVDHQRFAESGDNFASLDKLINEITSFGWSSSSQLVVDGTEPVNVDCDVSPAACHCQHVHISENQSTDHSVHADSGTVVCAEETSAEKFGTEKQLADGSRSVSLNVDDANNCYVNLGRLSGDFTGEVTDNLLNCQTLPVESDTGAAVEPIESNRTMENSCDVHVVYHGKLSPVSEMCITDNPVLNLLELDSSEKPVNSPLHCSAFCSAEVCEDSFVQMDTLAPTSTYEHKSTAAPSHQADRMTENSSDIRSHEKQLAADEMPELISADCVSNLLELLSSDTPVDSTQCSPAKLLTCPAELHECVVQSSMLELPDALMTHGYNDVCFGLLPSEADKYLETVAVCVSAESRQPPAASVLASAADVVVSKTSLIASIADSESCHLKVHSNAPSWPLSGRWSGNCMNSVFPPALSVSLAVDPVAACSNVPVRTQLIYSCARESQDSVSSSGRFSPVNTDRTDLHDLLLAMATTGLGATERTQHSNQPELLTSIAPCLCSSDSVDVTVQDKNNLSFHNPACSDIPAEFCDEDLRSPIHNVSFFDSSATVMGSSISASSPSVSRCPLSVNNSRVHVIDSSVQRAVEMNSISCKEGDSCFVHDSGYLQSDCYCAKTFDAEMQCDMATQCMSEYSKLTSVNTVVPVTAAVSSSTSCTPSFVHCGLACSLSPSTPVLNCTTQNAAVLAVCDSDVPMTKEEADYDSASTLTYSFEYQGSQTCLSPTDGGSKDCCCAVSLSSAQCAWKVISLIDSRMRLARTTVVDGPLSPRTVSSDSRHWYVKSSFNFGLKLVLSKNS